MTPKEGSFRSPLAGARFRGIQARERLVDHAGGLLSLKEAAKRLGVTPQVVTARHLRGTILAVPMTDGEWRFPACQFAEHGLIPGMDSVLRTFADDIDPWTRLAVLLADCGRVGGKSALALLQEGRLAEARGIAGSY